MDQANSLNDTGSDEISLKDLVRKMIDIFRYLLSKWKIITCGVLIGMAIGLAYSLIKKPLYKADLSFALEDETSSGGGLSAAMGLASQFGVDLSAANGGGAFAGDNLLLFMTSRSMVESALLLPVSVDGKNQTLADFYISFNHLRDHWQTDLQLKNLHYPIGANRTEFSLKQDSVLGSIYDNITKNILTVDKADKKLSIITVSVKSKNELFSKNFTESIVKTVSNFYVDTKTRKSAQNVRILQKQTDSVRRELNAAISGVASSVDNNPNANPALQILKAPSQRRQVDVQANQAILTELVRNLEVSKISLRKETPLIQIIDRPILPLDVEKPGKLKSMLIGGLLFAVLAIAFLGLSNIYKKAIV